MRIYRFVAGEKVRLGIGINGSIYDAASLYARAGHKAPDVVERADVRAICAAPDVVVVFLKDLINRVSGADLAENCEHYRPEDVRLLPPLPAPEKFICIGLNYMDHCEEQHKEPPGSPVIFPKFPNAICGHGDPILKPLTTGKLDFEGELAVIIGMGGRRILKQNALSHVFGYMIVNDISARDLQKQDVQFLRAKSQDTFGPMGPCIVTADEVPDPQTLDVETRVNGTVMQQSNTGKMIFSVATLIEFISQGMTLSPGDIISTGTPAGVGVHRNPPVFLKQGDRVEVEIQPIGVLANTVIEEA